MSGAFKTLAAALLVLLAAAGAVLYGPELLDAARPEAPEAVQFRPLPPPEAATGAPGTAPAPPASPARTPLDAPAAAPDGVLVTARILDASRRPLAGATLAAIRPQGPVARSGAAGEVHLLLDRPEETWERQFVVQAPGHATRLLSAVVHPDRPLPLGDVVLEPGGAVSGRVVDATGAPVPGAWVRAGAATGRRRELELERRHPSPPEAVALGARTGPGGRFLLAGVPTGLVRIWAAREGMLAAFSQPVEVRPGTESAGVELVLEPFPAEERIEGIVLGPGGDPAPRARIRYSRKSLLGSHSGSLSADREGRFRIVVDPGARYTLEARDREGRLAAARQDGVAAGTRDLVLRLRPARTLRLRVVDDRGRPVERFGVTVRGPEGYPVHDHDPARERPEGAVTVQLPEAESVVEVDAPGFAIGRAGPFPAGGAVPGEAMVRLEPLPGVTGLVRTAGGDPVAGARVRLHREVPADRVVVHNGFPVFQDPTPVASATTGPDGRFRLDLRERGRFRLRAEAPGLAPAELGPLDLDPATGLQDVELVLTEGGAIEGRLELPGGASPAGRIVGISRGDGYARTLRLGADGQFRFEHLAPGPWQVELRDEEIHPGASHTESHPGRRRVPANCTVREGETTWFDLGAGTAEAVVAGRLSVDDRPARGWTAILVAADTDVTSDAPRLLDPQGAFRLVAPRPGRYRLVLNAPEEDGAPPLVLLAGLELVPGTTPWSADLATGRLAGTGAPPGAPPRTPLAVTGGDPADLFYVAALPAGDDGRFELRVPAGPARIVRARWRDSAARPDTWPVVREVEVPARGVATVALGRDG